MLTRRSVLKTGFAAACTLAYSNHAAASAAQSINRTCLLPRFANADELAQESARGFQSLLPEGAFVDDYAECARAASAPFIVLPAVRSLLPEYVRHLREQVEHGAWVIWERAANFDARSETEPRCSLARFFDIRTSDRIQPVSMYIRYRWPRACAVRSFHDAVPVTCLPDEVIAECEGQPVSVKRAIGKGGIVFLGSMLGPGIRAEEREAQAIGRTILQICCGSSSPLPVRGFA